MEPLYNGQLGATILVHYSGVSALEGLHVCMYFTIGTQRFVRYIEVSAIEGCPLSGVLLYNNNLLLLKAHMKNKLGSSFSFTLGFKLLKLTSKQCSTSLGV